MKVLKKKYSFNMCFILVEYVDGWLKKKKKVVWI